jgi:hypothetical protein
VLQSEVDRQRLPGGVVLIARHGKVAMFEPLGAQDPATWCADGARCDLPHLLHDQADRVGGGADADGAGQVAAQ